jgi:hypothetical protein
MDEINDNLKPAKEICEEYNYPGPDSEEFNLLMATYNNLKKQELDGVLPRYEPSLTADVFTLGNYIKQKIWWHSGPDRLYCLTEEVKYITDVLMKKDALEYEKDLQHDKKVDELEAKITTIKNEFKIKFDELKNNAYDIYLQTVVGFGVVTAIVFVAYVLK